MPTPPSIKVKANLVLTECVSIFDSVGNNLLGHNSINSLDDIVGVNISNAATGNVLCYNGTEWVSANASTGAVYFEGSGINICDSIVSISNACDIKYSTDTTYSADGLTICNTGNTFQVAPSCVGKWDNKQDTLVSGTSIKTINGTSIIGSGNLCVMGSLVNFTESSCTIVGMYKTETHKVLTPIPDGANITNILIKRPSSSSSIFTDIKDNTNCVQGISSIDLGYVSVPGTYGIVSPSSVTCYNGIFSGLDNLVTIANFSTVLSGCKNTTSSDYSAVLSGTLNKTCPGSTGHHVVLGGTCNRVGDQGSLFPDDGSDAGYSLIGNGVCNLISMGSYNTIINGKSNCIGDAVGMPANASVFSTIINGYCSAILRCNQPNYIPTVLVGKCGQIGSNDTSTVFAIANGTSNRVDTTGNYNLIFCVDKLGKTVTNCLQVLCGTPAVGKVLMSDASGNASWGTLSAGGSTVTTCNVVYTATAAQTVFTLPLDSPTMLNVYLNGLKLPSTCYTIAASSITFTTGITLDDIIDIDMIKIV